jgi:uncharacterized protein with HEPN domain
VTREFRDYLDDMLEFAEKARSFIRGMSREQFLADEKSQFATMRALEVIGEAARRIPVEFRDRFPSIPRQRIIGMRNVLAHNYDGADAYLIYDTATIFVPALIEALPAIIAEAAKSP